MTPPENAACGVCRYDKEPVDFDRLEALAATLTEVIHNHAATWETQFDAGPGDVVSVSDAAWVIAKHLLTTEAEGA